MEKVRKIDKIEEIVDEENINNDSDIVYKQISINDDVIEEENPKNEIFISDENILENKNEAKNEKAKDEKIELEKNKIVAENSEVFIEKENKDNNVKKVNSFVTNLFQNVKKSIKYN